MTKIEYGSIEIITEVDGEVISEGIVFGPDDNVDDGDLAKAVKRLTGAEVAAQKANPHATERSKGVWTGKKNGKNAEIKVWVTER